MAHKTLIGGTAYEISGGKTLIGGTAYAINGGKTMVDGTVRNISFGTPINTLAVGSSVFMNVQGVRKEFLVVHQGIPDSTIYDASCNGTWLLMKKLYESRAWDSSNENDYANSDIHSYLNDTFVNLFDSDIKSVIQQVKLPYTKGKGNIGSLAIGSNGITTNVFLLSFTEVGFGSHTEANVEGAVLDYFNGASDSDRVGYLDDTAMFWWLRSPSTNTPSQVWSVRDSGSRYYGNAIGHNSVSFGVRPALILQSSACIDENFNVIA